MRVTKISSVLLELLSEKYLNLHSLKLNTMCSSKWWRAYINGPRTIRFLNFFTYTIYNNSKRRRYAYGLVLKEIVIFVYLI